MCIEELERIPRVKKHVASADCMDLEEVENKYWQYMQLWILYTEISIELRKKSELSKESVVNCVVPFTFFVVFMQTSREW